EELFKNPVIGWALGCLGAVPIARGKADTGALKKVTDQVEKGHGLLIFAEGTRSKDGRIGKIKSGAFVVASAAGVDMIPCRIIYNTKSGRMRLFCRVRVCFGPAIPAADLHIDDPRRSVGKIRVLKRRLNDCWDQLYNENRFPGSPTAEELNARPAEKHNARPGARPPPARKRPAAAPRAGAGPEEEDPPLELPKVELPQMELNSAEPEKGA